MAHNSQSPPRDTEFDVRIGWLVLAALGGSQGVLTALGGSQGVLAAFRGSQGVLAASN